MRSKTLKKNFQSKNTERQIVEESRLKDVIPIFLVDSNILNNLDYYHLSK